MADIEFDPQDLQEDVGESPIDEEREVQKAGPDKERPGGALGRARERSVESLRGLGRSVAGVGSRLKHTPVAERLNAAVDTRRVIRKAADAQRRQNHAMAYRLLEPVARDRPDDPQVIVAFWSAARACERADEAAPALVRTLRELTIAGKPERAAKLWCELHEVSPATLLDPGSLVRIVPALKESSSPDAVVAALRDAVDEGNTGLSPGIAVRVAEMALEPDPATALRAARFALASPDLHEARREYLEGLVAEGQRAEGGPTEDDRAEGKQAEDERAEDKARVVRLGAPAVAADPEDVAAAVVDRVAPATQFRAMKVTEAMPIGFTDTVVSLQVEGGRRGGVSYEKIEAVAVGAVADVVIVDLVLNWSHDGDEVLRIVRLKSDGFDPRMILEASDAHVDPLAGFLMELMARTQATPLPDPESALGLDVRAYDSLQVYEREVLQVDS